MGYVLVNVVPGCRVYGARWPQFTFDEQEINAGAEDAVHPDVKKLEHRSLYEQLQERRDEEEAAMAERHKLAFAPPPGLDDEEAGASATPASASGLPPIIALRQWAAHYDTLQHRMEQVEKRRRQLEEQDRAAFGACWHAWATLSPA